MLVLEIHGKSDFYVDSEKLYFLRMWRAKTGYYEIHTLRLEQSSSNTASLSSSDNPNPLMSCGLVSSPLVHDASAETASSCASRKETLVTCYIAKEETLNSCRNIAERLHSLLQLFMFSWLFLVLDYIWSWKVLEF